MLARGKVRRSARLRCRLLY